MKKEQTAIIDIEHFLGDTLIIGKVSTVGQLKSRMMATLQDINAEDFIAVFCARYNFEIIPYDQTIQVDYVIDLDIRRVYEPSY